MHADIRFVLPDGTRATVDWANKETPEATNDNRPTKSEVPDKRDTKVSHTQTWKNKQPQSRGYNPNRGVGGSTGYRAARNLPSMIYAPSTGCITWEEYYK